MPSSDETAAAMVPRDRVGEVWPAVAPWLQSALDRGAGEYALCDLRDFLDAEYSRLFVVADPAGLMAAAVVEVCDYPRTRLMSVQAAGGRLLAGVAALWPAVAAWARIQGCSGVRFVGRRGWTRVGDGVLPPGWRHMQDIVILPVEA